MNSESDWRRLLGVFSRKDTIGEAQCGASKNFYFLDSGSKAGMTTRITKLVL